MAKDKKLVFMVTTDHDDRLITANTLKELGHNVPIEFLSNTTELFAALQHRIPSIILVDYNATPETGVEILKQLKANDEYKSIPVVILTETSLDYYTKECYAIGACSVIKKPNSNEMTTQKIRTFFDYWVNVAETL